MMKKLYIYLLAAAAAVVSCAKNAVPTKFPSS